MVAIPGGLNPLRLFNDLRGAPCPLPLAPGGTGAGSCAELGACASFPRGLSCPERGFEQVPACPAHPPLCVSFRPAR